MLEVEVGDAVPWRPGHTVERLVPRDGTDLLTLDQHSKWGFTGWTVRTTDGGATQQHCCCWPLAPSLARSLAACTDWRRLNREKLPPERARAGTTALARSLARPYIDRPIQRRRRQSQSGGAKRTRTHQHRISPRFSSGPTKTSTAAAAAAARPPQPLVPRSTRLAGMCTKCASASVRPPARRPADRPTDVRVSPSCSGAA